MFDPNLIPNPVAMHIVANVLDQLANDTAQDPSYLQAIVKERMPELTDSEGNVSPTVVESMEATAKFLDTLWQMARQAGLEATAEDPPQLVLTCPTCGKQYRLEGDAVTSYWQRVAGGALWGCEDGHPLVPVGTGRHGELLDMEAAVLLADEYLVQSLQQRLTGTREG